MKLKHILVSSLLGVAFLSFQPNFVNAETDPSLQDINDTTQDAAEQIDTPDQATNNENQEYDESENTDSENNEATNEQDNTATNEDSDATENNEEYTSDNVESEFQPETDIQSPEKEAQDLDSKSETEDAKNPEDELETKADKTKEEESATLNNAEEKEDKSDSSLFKKTVSKQEKLNSKEVIQLKKDLTILGYGNMNINGTLGSFTKTRVKQFQRDNGLKATGAVDKRTLHKLQETVSTVFHQGNRHKGTITLKRNLGKFGFGGMNINNLYGSYTEKRMKDFQRYYNLPVTGSMNNETKELFIELMTTTLQEGKRDDIVISLKKDLNKLGFGGMNINNLYGSFTATRVKQFQDYYSLVKNGIGDPVTLDKLKNILRNSLQSGDKNKEVINMKKDLTILGYGNMNLNNNFGSFTKTRVKQFQRDHGLRVSGIVDDITKNRLTSTISSVFQQGKRHQGTITLKQNLIKFGFGGMNINNLYGSYTEKRVKDFQRYYNLPVTGSMNNQTQDMIIDLMTTKLQKGKRNNDVASLKQDLIKLRFGGMNLNETYGSYTVTRVKQLQRYYGLIVNGIADEPTLKKINQVITSPFQLNKKHKDTIDIKKKLQKAGFSGMNLNQTFGSYTEKQVIRFQKKYNLKSHGIVDDVTLQKLTEITNNVIRIFIDPGHGGYDPGASGNGLREKNLTLDIAKEIERLLKQYQNVEIKMARSTDEYLDLKDRTKMANDWRADYFLSVHINAGGGTGIESYVHNKNATADAKNKQSIIHDHLMNGLKADNIRDRGKKDANFHVLRESKMSALLIEYMFIDTNSDANKLKSTSFTNKLARLTAEGVAKAFGLKK